MLSTTPLPLQHLCQLLQHRADLLAIGLSDRTIAAQIATGELVRVYRGWYVSGSEWRSLASRERHVVLALAIHVSADAAPIFSHTTAALLHGLPMYGNTGMRVHVTVGGEAKRHNSRHVLRHRQHIPDSEVAAHGGVRFTSMARTVLDIARTLPPESGIVCADAALRASLRSSQLNPEQIRANWLDLQSQALNAQGSARARKILEMADPAADSPLESLSRLQLRRLGFTVATQVPVVAPTGAVYRMDFELLGHDVFAEVDGRVKYLDEQLRGGRSAEEVLIAEKEREDWVRGTTGKRVVRWGWDVATSHLRLASRLAAFGVEIPGKSRRDSHVGRRTALLSGDST